MNKNIKSFFFGSSLGNSKSLNSGWLLFRLHTGLSIALHAGFPKMQQIAAPGWFEEQVAGLGFVFPSPAFWATLASWGEFVGGLFIAIGFLTRFSALQLAFQFFVIAFLWYDHPEPLTGMYFQHTLFWSFVLIAAGGSGRYSLDHLIRHRNRNRLSPALLKTSLPLVLVGLSLTTLAQPVVKAGVFRKTEGDWKGTLTYLDYTSGKPFTMPVKLNISRTGKPEPIWLLTVEFPDEPRANGKDSFQISHDGRYFKGAPVASVEKKNGAYYIVTTLEGRDGNEDRKAWFRFTYEISRRRLIWRKEVRFEEEDDFFQRNEYRFTR